MGRSGAHMCDNDEAYTKGWGGPQRYIKSNRSALLTNVGLKEMPSVWNTHIHTNKTAHVTNTRKDKLL